MKIEGFTRKQMDELCNTWNLGKPIDVAAFLKRKDIPEEIKKRVYMAGRVSDRTSKPAVVAAHRRMQAAIVAEVARLDMKRWDPDLSGPE